MASMDHEKKGRLKLCKSWVSQSRVGQAQTALQFGLPRGWV